MKWLCRYISKMMTWFLTPNFWGFLLQLRRKWRGIMQIALSSWTVCTSFHIMIFLNDVFSVLSWRFGVQCLPSICGRIILLPCILSSSVLPKLVRSTFGRRLPDRRPSLPAPFSPSVASRCFASCVRFFLRAPVPSVRLLTSYPRFCCGFPVNY